jgi:hypothetical protein
MRSLVHDSPDGVAVPNNQSSHAWISRFCVSLLRLRPAISLGDAIRRAVTIYPHSGELEPEHAARLAAAGTQMAVASVRIGPSSTIRYRPVRSALVTHAGASPPG